jgi:hypothetical protein
VNSLPEMKVVVPANKTVVRGIHPLAAVASFKPGVAKVEYQISGATLRNRIIGTAFFKDGFWGLYWNSSDVPDGTYVIRCVAYNSSGDRSISKGITVRVAN